MLSRVASLLSFHPRAQPWITRHAYRHELVTSCTFPIAVAMVEGGVVGVLSKTIFETSDVGFAAIFAAPMFANLTSLLWTRVSRGRRKVFFSGLLMSALLMLVAVVALLPTTGWGPWGLVAVVVLSRCFMAGTITVRSAIWRLNFPREVRAQVTGKFVLIATLILAVTPIWAGPMLDRWPWVFRMIYPAAAVVGVVGVVSYLRIRVRQEPQLLRSERDPHADEDTPRRADGRPHSFASVLREDRHFRSYMTWQFFAGVANMMGNTAMALFIIEAIKDRPDANQLGMTLTATVPLIIATLTVPLWSKLLDRTHIAQYRISHGLTWVFGQALSFLAAYLGHVWLFFLPQVLTGVMRGGGMIAWQLGHNDFADRRLAALYMGIHQTLTGVRGAFAPFVGVWLLSGWDGFDWGGLHLPEWKGIGPYVFVITTAFAVIAWLGFVRLAKQLKTDGRGNAADG